jgi:hypothetical protein
MMSDQLQDDPEFRRVIGEVTWLLLAAQKYDDERKCGMARASYEIATNWDVKSAKRYLKTGKKPWEE